MRLFRTRVLVGGAGALLVASGLTAQEHGYTPADIENGSRLYLSSCAGCHGPAGNMVPGIELMRGEFRRGSTDTELIRIIQAGIPDTTMPPSSFSETQAGTIVAYLRSMAPSAGRAGAAGDIPRGDAVKGKSLFTGKAECSTCHRVNGNGPRVAPDLSDIGAIRQAPELRQKLLDPNALVRPGNLFVEAVTRDGESITGRVLNQDTFSIQLLDAHERLRSLSRSALRDYHFVRNSPMPSYRDKLTAEEVNDVVTYLGSLKGLRP